MSGPIVLGLRMLLALALYGFLGWALYVLWNEVQKQAQLLATRRIPGLSISIRQGRAAPVMRNFSQPEIILGRDPGCDIPLSDETVSTRHAQLTYHHGQWWVEDLASTNGTHLNKALVTTPTVLASGDEIRCGKTRLIVNLSSDVLVTPTQRVEKKT
jgi:pSer/pThr/pTyr-binding forkhead associated (FHA) protein